MNELLMLLRQQWDRVAAWIAAGVGAGVLLTGYLGVSGTPHVAEQLPYFVSAGLTGIFLLGVSGMLWISADLRDEWRELHQIRAALDRVVDDNADDDGRDEPEPRATIPEASNGSLGHPARRRSRPLRST